MAPDPIEVFIGIGRIDADKKNIRLQAIKNHIIDDAAMVIEQQVILSLKRLHARDIVGRDTLTQLQRSFAADFDFPHVAHVK